jgi:hypothetical protein
MLDLHPHFLDEGPLWQQVEAFHQVTPWSAKGREAEPPCSLRTWSPHEQLYTLGCLAYEQLRCALAEGGEEATPALLRARLSEAVAVAPQRFPSLNGEGVEGVVAYLLGDVGLQSAGLVALRQGSAVYGSCLAAVYPLCFEVAPLRSDALAAWIIGLIDEPGWIPTAATVLAFAANHPEVPLRCADVLGLLDLGEGAHRALLAYLVGSRAPQWDTVERGAWCTVSLRAVCAATERDKDLSHSQRQKARRVTGCELVESPRIPQGFRTSILEPWSAGGAPATILEDRCLSAARCHGFEPRMSRLLSSCAPADRELMGPFGVKLLHHLVGGGSGQPALESLLRRSMPEPELCFEQSDRGISVDAAYGTLSTVAEGYPELHRELASAIPPALLFMDAGWRVPVAFLGDREAREGDLPLAVLRRDLQRILFYAGALLVSEGTRGGLLEWLLAFHQEARRKLVFQGPTDGPRAPGHARPRHGAGPHPALAELERCWWRGEWPVLAVLVARDRCRLLRHSDDSWSRAAWSMEHTLNDLLIAPQGAGRPEEGLCEALTGLALYADGLARLADPPEWVEASELLQFGARLADPDEVARHYPVAWRPTMRCSWCWILEQTWSPVRLVDLLSTLLDEGGLELRPEELFPRFQGKLRRARGLLRDSS